MSPLPMTALPPTAPRLRDLLPGYDAYLIGEQRRPQGRAKYRKIMKQFIRAQGDSATMADLDARTVRRYKEAMGLRGCATSTVNNALAVLHDFCAWARTEGLRDDEPTALIARLPKKRPDPQPLYAHEVAALVQALHEPPRLTVHARWYWRRNRLAVLLMVYAGLRRAEVAALAWRHVNLDAGVLLIRSGKGGRDRRVPIHPTLHQAMLAIAPDERAARHRAVIGQPSGAPLQTVSLDHIFARWLRARGFDLHAHRLRHTFASHLVWHDADLRTVQDLLGHVKLDTIEHYVQTDMRRSSAAVNVLPDFRQSLPTERNPTR